jgi:hypothetical protein
MADFTTRRLDLAVAGLAPDCFTYQDRPSTLSQQLHGDRAMKEHVEKLAFVLLVIGTLGLLTNEFVFSWGRIATLIFAAINVIGLVSLGVAHWGKGK